MKKRLFALIVLVSAMSFAFAAQADTYECSCLLADTTTAPPEDCFDAEQVAHPSVNNQRITVDSVSQPPDDSFSNDHPTATCDAKCGISGPLCDACKLCLNTCANAQTGWLVCQLHWFKKGGTTPAPTEAATNGPLVNGGTVGGAQIPPVKLKNPLNFETVPELANNVIKTVVGVVGALALLIFIYGGLRWLTSAGEPAKIQAGKDAMKWAAIGLVVVFSSYALVNFVFGALTS